MAGWPAARTVQAERVKLFPSLLSLFTNKIHVAAIIMEKPYFSVVRVPGKLIMVPSLTEREKNQRNDESSQASARAVMISTIELKNGSLDLYDTTVSRPPLRTRMEEIQAKIQDVAAPAAEKTRFDLTGIVKGIKRDGRAKVNGWVSPGAKDSSSRLLS